MDCYVSEHLCTYVCVAIFCSSSFGLPPPTPSHFTMASSMPVAGCQPNTYEGEPGCNLNKMSWLATARWLASKECHNLCQVVVRASRYRLQGSVLQTVAAYLYPSLIAVCTEYEVHAIAQSDGTTLARSVRRHFRLPANSFLLLFPSM